MQQEKLPTRQVLQAIADTVSDTGLRVGDLPTVVQCWIADDDGDELEPGVICRLTDGRDVVWRDNDRVAIGRLVRVAGYARGLE